MIRKSALGLACGLAVTTSLSFIPAVHAAIDGSLTSDDGYTLVSTQKNITTSPTDGGGPGGVADEAAYGSTNLTQVSNAYASIDDVNNKLNLFIGGSLNAGDQGVSHYVIALQTQAAGVSSLNGQHLAGSVFEGNNNDPLGENNGNDGLRNIAFDSSFTPNALLIVDPSVGAYTGETNLNGTRVASDNTTIAGAPIANGFTFAFDNSLGNTVIGRNPDGTVDQSQFAAAHTGLELSIDLTALGYAAGQNILASVFTTNGGQDGRTNNQVLDPFTYGSAPSDYDYTYIDGPPSNGGNTRQFNNELDYPGNQFFTIAGNPVPEPASLSLLGLGGIALLRRRVAR